MENKKGIIDIVREQRCFFKTNATRSYKFRLEKLKLLRNEIKKTEKELSNALKKDLGKCEFESYASEIGFALYDLSHTIKNLKKWMKPKKVKTPILAQPATSKIIYTPLGVNLIISPFNYPIGLTLSSLSAAIAAGNTIIIKPSELTPTCSEIIEDLIKKIFNPKYVTVIQGGIQETNILLEQKFDHILFTGGPKVGAIVMTAAAKNLTPVTLELGGKNPCIVHSDANLQIAVNRIVYGKFLNLGQTCLAPDYILVHEDVHDIFLNMLKQRIIKMYGKNPILSNDYGRIVNTKHIDRLDTLIEKSKVIIGGEVNRRERYIAPTVIKGASLEDQIMQEEIFGPLLPVLTYKNIDDIYKIIAKLPQHPLALYLFTKNKNLQKEISENIQFGGGCINHCLQHFINPNLPFGGVGISGMGNYHGFCGFETFSHKKSLMKAATWFDSSMIYPPYKTKLKIIKMLMK
jgi:aldehyde dehydrogenase (NAD+)